MCAVTARAPWSPEGAYQYRDQAADLARSRSSSTRALLADRYLDGPGIIAMTYAGSIPSDWRRLFIQRHRSGRETGSQRITQMVGSRPDEFATLEMPWLIATDVADRRGPQAGGSEELALACCVARRRPWVWEMVPQYVQQRVAQGPPARPPSGPCSSACRVRPWSSGRGQRRALRATGRRMAETLPKGAAGLGARRGHAPTLVDRSFSQHSAASGRRRIAGPPAKSHRPQMLWPAQSRASIVSGLLYGWAYRPIHPARDGRIWSEDVQVPDLVRVELAVCEAYARRAGFRSDARRASAARRGSTSAVSSPSRSASSTR